MYLLVVILALSTATFQDASITEARSLISVAKNNPEVFVAMFEGTPKDKLVKIIDLLEALIATAKDEISQAALEKYSVCNKKIDYSCDREELDLFVAKKQLESARGRLQQCSSDYDSLKDSAEDEIATLDEIIIILNRLKDPASLVNISNAQSLLSKAKTTMSMLSMVANADADPQLIQEVIVMLNDLIRDAKKELNTLLSCMRDAERDVIVGEAKVAEAKHALDRCEDTFRSIKAACEAATVSHDYISRANQHEIQTLSEIIRTLANLV